MIRTDTAAIETFVMIGRLDRTPLLRFTSDTAPTAVLFVETAHLAVSPDDSPESLAAERHAVHFTGEEARILHRRLAVGQRVLIRASLRHTGRAARGEQGAGAKQRTELIAHTVRILKDNDAVAAPEERRQFLRGLFERIRATRGVQAPGHAPR